MWWQKPFWNRQEARLRAGWRIVLLLVLTLVLSVVVLGWAGSTLSAQQARILYLLAAGLLLALWVPLAERRSWLSRGFGGDPRWWRGIFLGTALGGLAVSAVFVFQGAAGWVELTGQQSATSGSLLVALGIQLLLYVLVGVYEEALCRGALLQDLREGLGQGKVATAAALIISSLLFALMHAGNPGASWLSFFNVFLLGVAFAIPRLRGASLAVPIGLHVAWNFLLGPVFGLPVSGAIPESSVLAVQVIGPPLWTGGEFGPEGGLLVSAAALLLALVLAWASPGPLLGHRSLRPVEPSGPTVAPADWLQQRRIIAAGSKLAARRAGR